jgi:fluoride exporter
MIQKYIWLALAGGLGTLARYGLAGFVHKGNTAWGTMAVNITGCFLAGLLWVLFEKYRPGHNETRVLILVGFLGAFTTFSAFIMETGELIQAAQWVRAVKNVFLQNALGFGTFFLGMVVGRIV